MLSMNLLEVHELKIFPFFENKKEVRKEFWDEVLEITKQAKGMKEGTSRDDFMKPIGGEVILENSPVGESQSNGFIENGIR